MTARPFRKRLGLALALASLPAWAQTTASQQPQPANPPAYPASSPVQSDMQAQQGAMQQGQQDPANRSPSQQEQAPTRQPDPLETEFDRMDRDGDGNVTANEQALAAKDRFDAMDADHNYHVSAEEMADADPASSADGPASAAGKLASMDANRNGELSVEEIENDAESRFRARDANGDGSLSLDEMRGMAPPQEPAADD